VWRHLPLLTISLIIFLALTMSSLPGQRRKADFELSQRCRDDGSKFFATFSAEANDPSMHYVWDDPEFHYSTKRNTCLVFIRFLGFSSFPNTKARPVFITTG
jgi:hypothetical protein